MLFQIRYQLVGLVLSQLLLLVIFSESQQAVAVGSWSGELAGNPVSQVYIAGISFKQKKPDFGGETCVAMYLQSLGHDVTQDDVFDAARLDPIHGRGCVTKELVDAAQRLGFQTGDVWFQVNDDRALQAVWNRVLGDLKKRVPSVVCRIHKQREQFVLVIGYDSEADRVIFHDPNIERGENQTADRAEFLRSCQLRSSNVAGEPTFSCVIMSLAGRPVRIVPTRGYTDADFAQHIRKLKTKLPHDDFNIVLQKPFVVVGDGSVKQVKQAATGTVKWAVDSIKQDYFAKDPHHIIDVWLFKDPDSYKKHNQLLFNLSPETPYGYYSPTHRVLVMDISTGGGTLVHEIVHPFMESNFEACPSWFNEGLASLYEQSSSRNGHIVGLTNWRLRGLQLAIADERLPSFEELCSTTTREFYDGANTNYAQARYLCYYLQEKGLLIKYFHQFRKNAESDPGGYETLKQVLGRNDIPEFQREWENYVSKLRFN